MNGYTLTFGGLLLLGGRAGDILGRRRMFIAGITIFTLASLAGGLATSAAMLLAARAVQGVGGALASPAVLALVVSGFAEGRERTRALGHLRRRGDRRQLARPGARRPDHRVALLALGAVHQRPDRHRSSSRSRRCSCPRRRASPAGSTSPARSPPRPASPLLVYGFIRAASDGWGNRVALASFGVADRAARGVRGDRDPRVRSRSRRCGCSPTSAGPARSRRGCCWWRGCSGCSSSSPSSCRTCWASARCAPAWRSCR